MNIIVDIILVIALLSLFSLIRFVLKIRKVLKMHKDNPNIQGISIVNGEVRIIEKQDLEKAFEKKEQIEYVEDPVCHKKLDKKEAYRMVKDGVEYFFCSWECREAFLKGEGLL